MREKWRELNLGDVAHINPEVVNLGNRDRKFQYVDLSSVSSDRGIDESALASYTLVGAPGRARRVVRQGDVLVATVRPYLRGFAYVPSSLDGQVASTGFCVLRSIGELADSYFIWSVVRTPAFVDHLMSRATGSNYPAVRPDDIATFPVLLPPLDEQRRIVDLIAAVDAAIEAAETVATKASLTRQDLSRSWFVSTPAQVCQLGDISTIVQGSALPKSIQGVTTGDIPWFKIADMNNAGNEYDYTWAHTRVDPQTLATHKGKLLPCGTVVFPRVGGAILTENKRLLRVPGACDENHICVLPSDGLLPEYTFEYFQVLHLRSLVQPGSVPSLNQGLIRELSIPVPSIPEQQTFCSTTSALRLVEQTAKGVASRARGVRSAVLADLLSGEHEIPGSYDYLLTA